MADVRERNPSQQCNIKRARDSSTDGGDFISSMPPDEILHHILSFIPTDLTVRTSVLSKRWRHVWCEAPCLSFDGFETTSREINQTLNSHKAQKITSFCLNAAYYDTAPVDSWIKFAMSRKVEKLSLSVIFRNYSCPEFLFLSSSLKQLNLSRRVMIPRCTVSWTSLTNLTLSKCTFSDDEAISNILSGCPTLEFFELDHCHGLLQRLDLTKSLSLRRLEIILNFGITSGPMEIIAPQIHYLRLTSSEEQCTLVDVSSLTEATLDISINSFFYPVDDFVQTMVLKMLEKMKNVERLTFGRTLFEVLSRAETRGVPFPTLKVQTLIVETEVIRYVNPGITRLLQNSPELKKLIVQKQTTYSRDIEMICKNAISKLFYAWFKESVLRNSKTIETLVVQLKTTDPDALECFAKLLQRPPTLSHNNNVSIVLNPSNYSLTASVSLS